MSEKEKQMLVAEVNILRELRHTQVVRYYDRIIDRKATKIFIVMELCEGGDVAAMIKKHKRERYVGAACPSLPLCLVAPCSEFLSHNPSGCLCPWLCPLTDR